MRFAVDADPIGRDGSGNETYLRGIVGGLSAALGDGDELLLFGSVPDALREAGGPDAAVIGCRSGIVGDLGLGWRMRAGRPDSVLAHYNLPLALGCPAATIVHDVAFLRVGETFPRALRARLRLSVRRSVSRSAAVVTVSEFSRQELLSCYPRLSPDRIVVAPNAPKAIFGRPVAPAELEAVRQRFGLPAEFVLGVGNIQPRKNLGRLVKAAEKCGLPLVLAGQLLHAPPDAVPSSARWLGRVGDEDLAALYRLCSVFAYVSLYEGFGLPVIEALSAGTVVVTSDCSALPEVAGGAAVLVDPGSVDSIAAGLELALSDTELRNRLAQAGPVRSAAYAWSTSAAAVMDTLRHIAP